MEKVVLSSASFYTQKYYLNPEFDTLPTDIRNQLRYICIPLAEKLHCIFTIGFYSNGSVYIETKAEEVDYDYDDIGSKLEIKKLEKEKEEFFETLRLWYFIYKTSKGNEIKEKFLQNDL